MKSSIHCIAIVLLIMTLAGCASSAPSLTVRDEPVAAECHPSADAGLPQYVIGYGSLMQDESRARTSPHAGPAFPIEVTGYQRAWIARSDAPGLGATYLGVSADPAHTMNAVIYRVEIAELEATDQRESSYCRERVPAAHVRALDTANGQIETGQAWIYVNKPGSTATPSARFPIVESYVDIFVSGCLEQEQRFHLEGFAQQCITTTSDWSEHWVNDRIYPRRPFIYQPRARQIDTLLAKHLPQYFSRIRIE